MYAKNFHAILDGDKTIAQDTDEDEADDFVNTYHSQLINEKLIYNTNMGRNQRLKGQYSQRENRKRPLEVDNE